MTHTKLRIVFAVVGMLSGATFSAAAGLTDADNRYLEANYGSTVRNEIVDRMTGQQQAKLHEIINGPFAKDYPGVRYDVVADYLFLVHIQ